MVISLPFEMLSMKQFGSDKLRKTISFIMIYEISFTNLTNAKKEKKLFFRACSHLNQPVPDGRSLRLNRSRSIRRGGVLYICYLMLHLSLTDTLNYH